MVHAGSVSVHFTTGATVMDKLAGDLLLGS